MERQSPAALLLAPWLQHASLSPTIATMPSTDDLRDRLWVDVTLPDDSGRWPTQFDVLELLTRFARVDARGAWKLVLDATRKLAYLDDFVSSKAPMRFRLTVPPSVLLADDAARATLHDLLGWGNDNVQGDRTHASGFSDVKNAIVALGKDASGDDYGMLCIWQRHFGTSAIPLARLVALAEIQHAAASRPANGFQWKWTHVALDYMQVATLDTMYDYLGQLLDRGVRVERLQVNPRAVVMNGAAVTDFWRRSLEANGFDSLMLPAVMEYQTFERICRGLATATMTTTTSDGAECYRPSIQFEIADGALDLAMRWAWLTAVLAHAANYPERIAPRVALNLSGLRLPQARVIAGLMAAHQNRPRATQLSSTTTPVDRFLILRGRAKVRADVSANSSGFAVADATALRVVEGASSLFHTGVHWAGSPNGIGWVRKVDVVRVDELPRLHPHMNTSALWIDHVTVCMSRRLSLQAVVVVLRAMNMKVRRLTVRNEGDREDLTRFGAALLDACPSLERLDIATPVANLDWLLDRRRLRVLSLEGWGVDIRPLVQVLSNRDDELTKSLRELLMDWQVIRPFLEPFVAMLGANTRLKKCIVTIFTTRHQRPVAEPAQLAAFRACSVVQHVELPSRLAFLSVFTSGAAVSSCSRIPFLDHHLQVLVLAFAVRRPRRCDVVYESPRSF